MYVAKWQFSFKYMTITVIHVILTSVLISCTGPCTYTSVLVGKEHLGADLALFQEHVQVHLVCFWPFGSQADPGKASHIAETVRQLPFLHKRISFSQWPTFALELSSKGSIQSNHWLCNFFCFSFFLFFSLLFSVTSTCTMFSMCLAAMPVPPLLVIPALRVLTLSVRRPQL